MKTSRLLVCSMIFRDDSVGLGALVNSLACSGFRGEAIVGYDGTVPLWLTNELELPSRGDERVFAVVDGGIRIRLRYVDPTEFYGNQKPAFLLNLHTELPAGGFDGLVYFDPDIVVKCSWMFFEEWLQAGIALVEDVNAYMPSDHPKRRHWLMHARKLGLRPVRTLTQYFNSGFIGVPRFGGSFLRNWTELLRMLDGESATGTQRELGDADHPFYKHDQDCLNAAAMVTDVPLSTVGPDGMDFTPGGFIMSHAIGPAKPWRKAFLLQSLQGMPPSAVDRAFWMHARSPLPVFPSWRVRLSRASLTVAAAIGRTYRRRGT